MPYKLHYFAIRGRGEQIRLLLHALAIPFEDVRVSRAELAELKKQGPSVVPFGALPLLEDGALLLAQGPVILGYLARKHGIAPADLADAARADALTLGAEDLRSRAFATFGGTDADARQAAFVAGDWTTRWLPSFDGLLAQNGHGAHFVGSSLTHADVAIWDALDFVTGRLAGATLDAHPRLAAFAAAFAARPAVARYLAERPEK